MSRLGKAAFWTTPALVCLALYWYGLKTWFFQDDFAWLRLADNVRNGGSLLTALFAPMAQGTVRPLSERAFFIVFYGLFGLDALPFRIWVFLTQIANLALLAAITRRLTGSPLAGVTAALLWISSSTMYVVMTWSSVYNQVLCAFCLLAAFYFLLRYIEAGRTRDYYLQWIPFLLGFGVLEITVVYPVLAAFFTLLCARKFFTRTLPLFIPSVAFGILHLVLIPKPEHGVYGMHFDAVLRSTLWTYWQWALGPAQMAMVVRLAPWLVMGATLVLTVGVAALLWRRHSGLPVFFLAWFLITLALVLPLENHLSDYYLTIPSIGLAMLGGWALVNLWRPAVIACIALYLAASVPTGQISTRASYQRSKEVEKTVLGVARAHQLHGSQVILLEGVDDDLFWNAMRDDAFAVVGAPAVYLTPGSETRIHPNPYPLPRVVPDEPVLRGLERGDVVVYDVTGPRLRNVTSTYRASASSRLKAEAPWRVDVSNPLVGYLLSPEWYRLDQGFRWMPKRATVRIHGPRWPEQRLFLSGRAYHATRMRVSVEGIYVWSARLPEGGEFSFGVGLPPAVLGRDAMEAAIEVDRTFRAPADPRELGLAFGVFEVR